VIRSEPTIQADAEDQHVQENPVIQEFIDHLQTSIAEHPKRFADALFVLGAAATTESIAIKDVRYEAGKLPITAADLIVGYFSKRFDRFALYDPETESALSSDESFKELRDKHLTLTGKMVMTGKMSNKNIANPSAENARNAARRATLDFFITRRLAWAAQQAAEAPEELPSAG
jgi:hypothetical protein